MCILYLYRGDYMLKTNLKNLRLEKKLTQEELAKVLNLSVSTISMYETGSREPDISTLKNISEYFNVTCDYLLGLSSNRHFNVVSVTSQTDTTAYLKSLKDVIETLLEAKEE